MNPFVPKTNVFGVVHKRMIVVAGPPGGGKSTYAEKKAGRKGEVVDMDRMAEEIEPTAKPYQYSGQTRYKAQQKREQRINQELKYPRHKKFVVVDTSPSNERIKQYRDAGAKKFYVDPGEKKALKRVKNERPAHYQYVTRKWYANDKDRLKEQGFHKPLWNVTNR